MHVGWSEQIERICKVMETMDEARGATQTSNLLRVSVVKIRNRCGT
jgi:hypothetical protein